MLFSQSTIDWQECTMNLRLRDKCMTLKKTLEQLFASWEAKKMNISLILKRSLLVVAVLEPSLPYSWPMLYLLSTKEKAAIQGKTLILTVFSLSQECLKKSSPAISLMTLRLQTAVTQVMTTQMTLLVQISHRWFCSMEQTILWLLMQTAKLFTIVLSLLV